MPRLVRHDLMGPIKIEPQEKAVWVCGCGLSATFPMCDGTHKTCHGEAPGKLYVYDPQTKQVIEEREEAGAGE